jgi:hypothetical protein
MLCSRSMAIVLCLLQLGTCCSVYAQQCNSEVVDRNRQATVRLHVKKTMKGSGAVRELYGTGFIVSPSGYVLTNNHVVERGSDVDDAEVTGAIASSKAASAPLDVIGRNEENDLALLKFQNTSQSYKSVILGDPASVRLQTLLCSVGFPIDSEIFSSSGPLGGKGGSNGTWLTQMPSNPGESGAPVFIESGQVVAIKVGGIKNSQNLNVLVPLNLAQNLLNLVPDRNLGPYAGLRQLMAEAGADRWVKFSHQDSEAWDTLTIDQLDNCVFTYRWRSYLKTTGGANDSVREFTILLKKLKPDDVDPVEEMDMKRWSVGVSDRRGNNALGQSLDWLLTFNNAPSQHSRSVIQFGQPRVRFSLPTRLQAERGSALLAEIIRSCQ